MQAGTRPLRHVSIRVPRHYSGGFCTLAEQLGKVPSGASRTQKVQFWRSELEAVYELWA
jgi:hypothetical protein